MIAVASRLGPFRSYPGLDDSAQARFYKTNRGSWLALQGGRGVVTTLSS